MNLSILLREFVQFGWKVDNSRKQVLLFSTSITLSLTSQHFQSNAEIVSEVLVNFHYYA